MTRIMKTYTEEFRQEAVKLVTEQHMSRTQVARDLGMNIDTLARWVRAAAPAPATAALPESSAAECARLRRELERVQMERDILKKALGICSQMPR